MEVNFIVTVFDKETYLPHLFEVLDSYSLVRPTVTIAYNGPRHDFQCNVRRPNMGLQHGDHDLTVSGYNHFRTLNDGFRFIKIGIDTFLLDEKLIVHIFETMERGQCCYAGNRWHHEDSPTLATDIIFLDTRFGNPLDPPHGMAKVGHDYESWMWHSIHSKNLKWLEIEQRKPVHMANRHECEKLKWTMHHQLERNVENMRKWGY
jgi:hypothetical protein